MAAETAAKHARFAAIEQELARLGVRHDLAMSAFRFDEARELQRRIVLLEQERDELIATLPAPAPARSAAPVPIMIRPRRWARRRRPPGR
jgi:hypothetical protein